MYFKHGKMQLRREEEMEDRLRNRGITRSGINRYRKHSCLSCQRERKHCACDLANTERDEIVFKNLLKELKL